MPMTTHDTTTGSAPAWPSEPLPHPFTYENGMHPCNAPLVDSLSGRLSGYCEVPVARRDRWRRPAGTHRGDHRITWPNKPNETSTH